MPARIEFLRAQYGEVRDGIDAIERRAADERRDPTDSERADLDTLYARATQVGEEITAEAERSRPLVNAAEVLARIGHSLTPAALGSQFRGNVAAPPPLGYAEALDYIVDNVQCFHRSNPTREQDMAAFVEHYRAIIPTHDMGGRPERGMPRFRTVAQQITTDNAGILPTPILGPITSFIDGQRRLVPSFTQRPLPAVGTTFNRPKITSHASVNTQTSQGTEVASGDIQITSDSVTKFTEAGTLQISQQDLDWTDPSILQIVVQDFLDVYARRTDLRAATSFIAAVTANASWVSTDPGTIVQSVLTGTKNVYTACCMPADTLWLAVDAAASLAAVVDSNKRPVFTEFGTGRVVANDLTFGLQGFLGLDVVVSPDLTAGKKILGVKRYAEWYEDRRGFLQLSTPSTLITELATYGYVATYFKAEGFTNLV